MPKMATFRPPGAEKLIFSDKTLPCSIDCAPKHSDSWQQLGSTRAMNVQKRLIQAFSDKSLIQAFSNTSMIQAFF